jgi:hypothetical protein
MATAEPVTNEARQRAKTLTLAWQGIWNDATQKGRKAACPECGVFDVSITPKADRVLLICNACEAGKRGDNTLVVHAARDGVECGSGADAGPHRLWPASSVALDGMKRAERRVLTFVAAQTVNGDWLEVSQREIAIACRTSKRDPIPLLQRLADRGLLRVRSNNYAAKRRTQVAFMVDPADLCRRLTGNGVTMEQAADDDESSASENGVTPSENGVTLEHSEKMVSPPSQSGVTMERASVRIRGSQGMEGLNHF